MTMTEVFKTIEIYDTYSVSNEGRVRNDTTGKFLKGSVDTKGYLQVGLYKDCKRTLIHKHRLVAQAFIPNPECKPCADHNDCNKLNNKVENLRWATFQENARNIGVTNANNCGVKGVHLHKPTQKWQARIMIDGIAIHLGYFDTIEEATLARQTRANEAFGVFTNACEMSTY